MAKKISGWKELPQFEDKVLFHIVDLAGDMPVAQWSGIKEGDLLARLSEELGVPADFANDGQYTASQAHSILWESLEELKRAGLTDHTAHFGPDNEVRPTRDGRRQVQQWREEWERNRLVADKRIQLQILKDLDAQRRADPDHYKKGSRVDLDRLYQELGIVKQEYLANARRLLDQGKIAEIPVDQADIADGWGYITESGIRALEIANSAERPQRDAQEAWVEVARLKRELRLAQRTLPSLIRDDELRARCSDILSAGGQYDRVIREACVILEDRVRKAAGFGKDKMGTGLMQSAFSTKGGPLQLSDHEQEQVGYMQIYAGIMAAFRNAAGHNVVDSYTQEDALRFVSMIDLLLEMVSRASATAVAQTTSPASIISNAQPPGSN
jgi:uncharacterized protein (TIGR02391 family)